MVTQLSGEKVQTVLSHHRKQKKSTKKLYIRLTIKHLETLKSTGMVKFIRTDSDNDDFIGLVKYLDADLAARDGGDHSFYAQFNKINKIKYAVVAYEDDEPIGCGAIKELSPIAMEVKRMYTLPPSRGKGIATMILKELEVWAGSMGYKKCALETGKRQVEAIELYKKNGYKIIPNYGQYVGVENSVCFEKELLTLTATL